jgi:hypothetical protein
MYVSAVLLTDLFVWSTGCCSLVVVLSLSKGNVVSSSSDRAGCVKPKMFKNRWRLLLRQEHGIQKVESRVFRI